MVHVQCDLFVPGQKFQETPEPFHPVVIGIAVLQRFVHRLLEGFVQDVHQAVVMIIQGLFADPCLHAYHLHGKVIC